MKRPDVVGVTLPEWWTASSPSTPQAQGSSRCTPSPASGRAQWATRPDSLIHIRSRIAAQ